MAALKLSRQYNENYNKNYNLITSLFQLKFLEL